MRKIILFSLLLLLTTVVAATPYEKDPSLCLTSYQAQDCATVPIPKYSCGWVGSPTNVLTCETAATMISRIPITNTTITAGTVLNASYGGGYIMDCLANTLTCPGNINWQCQANLSCNNGPVNRATICLASTTSSQCGACLSTYTSCNSAGVWKNPAADPTPATTCEDTLNSYTVSPCENPSYGGGTTSWHTEYYQSTSCACHCNTNWLDCDRTGGVETDGGAQSNGNGCEVNKLVTQRPGYATNHTLYGNSCTLTICDPLYYDFFGAGHVGADADGCEIRIGEACTSDASIPGTCAGDASPNNGAANAAPSGRRCHCIESSPITFQTSVKAIYNSPLPLLWGLQNGPGILMSLSNGSGTTFNITNGGCIQFRDGTTQCSGTSAGGSLWNDNGSDIYNTNTGKVGIGTTNPTIGKLQVVGRTFLLPGASVNTEALDIIGGGTNIVTVAANRLTSNAQTDLNLFSLSSTGAQSGITIQNGNVGIGTSSPTTKLSIVKNDLNTDNVVFDWGKNPQDSSTNSAWMKIFGTVAGVVPGNDRTWAIGNNGYEGLAFVYLGNRSIAPSAGTEVLTIGSDGKVGIGATSPTTLLETKYADSSGLPYNNGITINNYYTGAFGSYASLNFRSGTATGNATAFIAARYSNFVSGTGNGGELVFGTKKYSDAVPSEKMRIDQNGNVGIGTANPISLLNIMGYNTIPQFLINRTDSPNQGFSISAGGGQTIFTSIEGTNSVYGDFEFIATKGSSQTTRMIIDNNGNVGIGTTSSTDKLTVAADNSIIALGESGGANLLYNGGAEDGSTGWTSRDFGVDGSAGSGWTSSTAFSGLSGFVASNDGGFNQPVEVIPSAVYTVTLRMRVNSQGPGDAAQGRIVVGTSATGREIVDKTCNPDSYDLTPNINKWVFCSATFTAPAATDVKTTTIYVGFRGEAGTHIVLVDNVMLSRGGIPQAYNPITTLIGNNGATLLTGNVGIGTATPSAKLTVNGNVSVNNAISSPTGNVIIVIGT